MSERGSAVTIGVLAIAIAILALTADRNRRRLRELEETAEVLRREQASVRESLRKLDAYAMDSLAVCTDALARSEEQLAERSKVAP